MKTTVTCIILLCLTSSTMGFARVNPVVMTGIMNGALGEAVGQMKYAIMAMYPQLMQNPNFREYLLARVLNEQNLMQYLMIEYPAEMANPLALFLVQQMKQAHMVQYIAPIAANFRELMMIFRNEPWLPLLLKKSPAMTMKMLAIKLANAQLTQPGAAADPNAVTSPAGGSGGMPLV